MIKFLGNRLLLTQKPPINQSKGGIFLPQQSLEPRNIGTVTNIGTTVDEKYLGKDIMFHIQSAQDFEHDETKGKLIFVTDIIAIL